MNGGTLAPKKCIRTIVRLRIIPIPSRNHSTRRGKRAVERPETGLERDDTPNPYTTPPHPFSRRRSENSPKGQHEMQTSLNPAETLAALKLPGTHPKDAITAATVAADAYRLRCSAIFKPSKPTVQLSPRLPQTRSKDRRGRPPRLVRDARPHRVGNPRSPLPESVPRGRAHADSDGDVIGSRTVSRSRRSGRQARTTEYLTTRLTPEAKTPPPPP